MRNKLKPTIILILTMLFIATSTQSETKQNQSLQGTIMALDKTLFDAFNSCDLKTFNKYLAEDIEFYQDNDDVTVTRKQLEPSFNDRCKPDKISKLRRELVAESVEVHSIQGFGAVQFGTHRFWIKNHGEPDQLGAAPRFVHLWRLKEDAWQITRVISYGH